MILRQQLSGMATHRCAFNQIPLVFLYIQNQHGDFKSVTI